MIYVLPLVALSLKELDPRTCMIHNSSFFLFHPGLDLDILFLFHVKR